MSNLYATSPAASAEDSEFDGSPAKTAATHTANVAADQASKVGDTAAHAAGEVADVTKDEVGKVAAETKKQAKDLLTDARSQLTEQAGEQQARVADGLRSISDELTQMATVSDADGVATDLVRQAASRAGRVATWLDDRDPGSLLDEVRSYARRKPGTFIALAAAAGILAGRLTRSVAAESADEAKSTAGDRSGIDTDTTPRYTGAADPGVGLSGTGGAVGQAGIVGLTDTSDRTSVAGQPGLLGDDPDLAVPER
ncbi:hypothetical protein E3O06_04450 [Cryobacterium glaciale]|uniref:DUF3618 domain-containing protein n=1 Tax=Cryobacterium glaciale TaxID=1259145 RepID=A0A4R8V4A3_9MICO|nr:hypothetical protein [Cryobacterium glaciale]TFB75895.1 hypothetical protein E3O06_04450 [Cryobacterium glaciale]